MLPLDKDLQQQKNSLNEFTELTIRILNYLPNVLTGVEEKGNYLIFTSNLAGTLKYTRPINKSLFLNTPSQFKERLNIFYSSLKKLMQNHSLNLDEQFNINSVIYTIQQSIGLGLDLLVKPNSARKHVGNRFEELIKSVFNFLNISNKHILLQIPYETESKTKTYTCENDLILSPSKNIKSTNKNIDENEIVISVKTSSKDRLGKIFIDKILIEKFIGHKTKVVAIFLNDVQRKEAKNISYTFVSGLFMVYTKFLTQLEGIYYLDPPPKTQIPPFNKYIKKFSDLICSDLRELFSS